MVFHGEVLKIDILMKNHYNYDFKNIFNEKNCNFINLQYGDVNQILKSLKKIITEIITLSNIDLFNDFDGLAALLKI